MKINFSTPLKDIYGNPLDDGRVTLAVASISSLMAPQPSADAVTPPISGMEMLKRYDLASRIHNSGEGTLDISPEEAVLLRDRIAVVYQNPVVVAPAWRLLEG